MDLYNQKKFYGIRWIFFGLFLLLFAADTYLVVTGKTAKIDGLIAQTIFDLHDETLTILAKAVTFCGNTKTVGALCILLIILPGRLKVGLPVALATGLGSGCHYVLKELIERPRPDTANLFIEVDGFSFPSGHANGGLIFYVFLMVLVGRVLILQNNRLAAALLRILLSILVALIGFSRIYLGVHYPSDILGGWLLGSALLILFFTLYDRAWPAPWRVSYETPNWRAIPKNAEKNKGWRKPAKKHTPDALINFPKKRGAWKIPPDQRRRQQKGGAEAPGTAPDAAPETVKEAIPEISPEKHTPLI
jgi:undecaprenyl-diphosphatase